MNTDPVTLYFLTWQGVNTLAAGFGVLLVVVLVWLALFGSERNHPVKPESWLTALAWGLGLVWVWLLGATIWGLWQVFNGVANATLAEGSLGLGALIAAFLGAPFLIYGTYLRHKTQRLEQEGHMTDRITAAVDQLGAEKTEKLYSMNTAGEPVQVERTVPNIEVRMGAILSLERIAQDSTIHDKGRDHVRVMEIICAYIRENSNARKPLDFPLADWEPLKDGATEEERAEHLAWSEARFDAKGGPLAQQWAHSLPKPRADVQLALSVIGRRQAKQLKVEAAWPDPPNKATTWPFDPPCPSLPESTAHRGLSVAQLNTFRKALSAWKSRAQQPGYRLDLRGANLQRADLSDLRADGATANFSAARLEGARLEGANLRNAQLEGANLRNAQLSAATLVAARLESASMISAQMEVAVPSAARLHLADLTGSTMVGCNLKWAQLCDADLSHIIIEGADLMGAIICGTRLRNAYMSGANFFGARIDDVLIWKGTGFSSYIDQALMTRSAALGTDWSQENLDTIQGNFLFGDASVILPTSVNRPAHWPDWELPAYGAHAFEAEWRKWQDDPENYVQPEKPK